MFLSIMHFEPKNQTMNKMKRWAWVMLCSTAFAPQVQADDWDFPYLVLTESSGEEHVLGVSSLNLVFDGANLTAENGEQSLTLPLESLAEMHFSDSEVVTTIDRLQTENGKRETMEVYDLQGRRLDAVSSRGLYIINGKKVLVK